MFTPDSIRKSSYVPPVVFSKLMVANEDVIPGERSILKVDLDDTQELVLSHDENIFSVQYAALDYTNRRIYSTHTFSMVSRSSGLLPTGKEA